MNRTEKFTCKDILEKVSSIKKEKRQTYSNYLPLIGCKEDKIFHGYTGKSTVIYFKEENIAHRIVFFSSDRAELIELLKKCPKGIGLDIASNKKEIEDDFVIEGGFHKVAVLQRLTFPDGTMADEDLLKNEKFKTIYADRDDEIVEYAQPGDEKELLRMLKKTFNIYIDHIPTEEEILNDYIKRNGILVCRENGKIVAMVGLIIKGSRMFWEYAINNSGAYKKMSALVVRSRDIALANNVKFMHSFVELSKNRERALKYYKRRDARFDDFYNHVYANVDINVENGE